MFYIGVIKHLLARIHRVRPEYRKKESWCLLHDNASAHRSMLITDFFTKNGILMINHLCIYLIWLRAISFCSECYIWLGKVSVMQTLKTLKGRRQRTTLLTECDANLYCTIWRSTSINGRGRNLEFLAGTGSEIPNRDDH